MRKEPSNLYFLADGGELGALMRRWDWSATSLGAPTQWSQSLRTVVRLMLNTHHPMYIFWGRDGACLYNDAYRQSIGAERHPGSLGQPARQVWAEIWDVIGPQVEHVMAGRGATWHENQLIPITRDGILEDVYWTYSYSPIDEAGEPNGVGGVLIVCTETTEQVESAARLAESEARVQLALSGGRGIGTWDWDVKKDRVVADERFARLYGVDPSLAKIGAPIANFFTAIHPEDVPHVEACIAAALTGKVPFNSEYRLIQPDGSTRWVVAEGRCTLADDGTPLRFPGVTFDITERKQAEAALRRLNADLERQVIERSSERGTIWNVSPFLMSVINLDDGRFARVNPAWTETLGWSEQEITGAPFLQFLHPEDVAASNAAFAQVQAGNPVINFDNRYRDKRGEYHWLSWVAVPENGKLYSTTRDVSAEKTAQAALSQAQEQLRQSQKMEAIGQLTGGLAHDFNNLMTIIRSAADFLRRADLPEQRRKTYLAAISDTVERAAKLTSQLLAFARRQPLQPQVFDVTVQVEAVTSLIRPLTGSRIEIQLEIVQRSCFAHADIRQFETALINLAVNARDAMNGEGRLIFRVGVSDEIPVVRAHPAHRGNFIAVSVVDAGSGISTDHLESIFEPFYTTKEVGKGTGLGLSQVFGFAKQSGGEIEVLSTLGQGSTFTLYLPRADAPSTRVDADDSKPEASGESRGHCILVVEDNKEVGAFTTEMLHDLGYKTRWVGSAKEALSLLAEDASAYHLVFSDVIMPGMNGVEMARRIRTAYPHLPTVLTSGYSQVLAEDSQHGFHLIQKPYSVEALSVVLRNVIEQAGVGIRGST